MTFWIVITLITYPLFALAIFLFSKRMIKPIVSNRVIAFPLIVSYLLGAILLMVSINQVFSFSF
ncbi:MAG: hypothetical protein KFKLKKLM_02091 [Flavobacteriales bacterium]|nr:hypothetical protein [Flavobacteriales bacterium]